MVEGVGDVKEVEGHDKGQGGVEGVVLRVVGREVAQVEHAPANQTRAQLAEKLQVQWADTGVQLTAHEEIIEETAWK